ncbi:Lactonase, 7-bladed beta-propeller-domain-containing protein [Xylariaceae sp. FL1272]|nr:Lactonase, 7-bladed beta-propeller-domain-containing protein [Xylariaceae sp. FL1272]
MTEPPQLFSWAVDKDWQFTHLDTVNITTSSFYFSEDGKIAFSAGGSGGRINAIDDDGAIGQQLDEVFFVPKEEIVNVDETRAEVLYGGHAFDMNVNRKAFVPHLGMNAIYTYDIAENWTADLLSVNLGPTHGDGPRNSYPTKDGKLLYMITEHNVRGKSTFRGNTAQPSRNGIFLFTSTRSWNNTEANGYAAAFELGCQGYLKSEEALTFYEAPLTLVSAGGLRVAFWEDETNQDPAGVTDYMYLSDTSEGFMYVLGWTPSNHSLDKVAEIQYPDNATPYEAVWLD